MTLCLISQVLEVILVITLIMKQLSLDLFDCFCDYLPVLQVCDEPHPLLIREMIKSCSTGDVDEAYKVLSHLWYMGYAPEDIITNIFRVCKNYQISEYLKLEFIKVRYCRAVTEVYKSRKKTAKQSYILVNFHVVRTKALERVSTPTVF